MDRTALVLADGTTFYGNGFGAAAPLIEEITGDPDGARLHDVGEVVFNTAMSGYGEVLTDPSYTGQIVVMTYPHVGNYGIDETWSETGTENNVPRGIQLAGLVVRGLYTGPVPPGRTRLDDYMQRYDIPGVTQIDTRALTLDLRDRGSRNGLLCRVPAGREMSSGDLERAKQFLHLFPSMEGRGLVDRVGTTESIHFSGVGGPHLALYDCGTKRNIIRELQSLGCELTVVPSRATAAEIRSSGAQALLLSNGPGDPAVLKHQVEQTRELVGEIPLLGICLGHQIIAEALGAETGKMKFGHHGVNHPVREEIPSAGCDRGRVFVTSQNHGFTVREETLPEGTRVWFRNANDGTVEGLWDDALRIRTTQFHPESAPGPTDSRWIFSAFLEVI